MGSKRQTRKGKFGCAVICGSEGACLGTGAPGPAISPRPLDPHPSALSLRLGLRGGLLTSAHQCGWQFPPAVNQLGDPRAAGEE